MQAMLALICSVALEADPLLRRLRAPREMEVGRRRALEGELEGRPVLLLPAGMGKVNAAQALTAAAETLPLAGVIGFGVGGAYPGAALEVGGVALATADVYGDEGVDAPAGWISTEGIGIPLLERSGRRTYNRFDLDAARVGWAHAALEEAGIGSVAGPFVTVSSCSGTTRRGEELAARHGAVCESMEGAAYAHVAALYDLPLLQLRGISNRVEDRDLSRWRLAEAAEAAGRAVAVLARAWRP